MQRSSKHSKLDLIVEPQLTALVHKFVEHTDEVVHVSAPAQE